PGAAAGPASSRRGQSGPREAVADERRAPAPARALIAPVAFDPPGAPGLAERAPALELRDRHRDGRHHAHPRVRARAPSDPTSCGVYWPGATSADRCRAATAASASW